MDKAEFTKRLFDQFKGHLAAIDRNTVKEIEGRKSRTDADTFKEWLKTEQEKAASSPALVVYDRVLRSTMNTPEGAATSLADLINFDLDGKVDWQKEWESAAPILSNFQPERSKDWKYRGNFLNYLNGSEADLRARGFARFIEIENGGFGIDIPAMVSEVLEKYPDLSTLQMQFEQILFEDYGKAVELARVTSLAHLRKKITEQEDGWKTVFLMALNGDMPEKMIEETKARAEMSIRFWDTIVEAIDSKFTQKPKAKKAEKQVLVSFNEALKDADSLPDLWQRLSEMEKPFVNESGSFIGKKEGRNVVKLLALAQAISSRIKPGFSQFEVYEMLCKLWDLPISDRPEKALSQSAYLPTLTEIKEVLS